ncbi:MarR family winged helix-turn-helix transcriptional regulator [Sneathiella chinensis]|uniref:MarR family transcriptional regulator n=1 Tax=Sneathiella chinensis TaxID=349750 RepID=A0ABQ5U222_9PROT|nr:MarR family transcriptional regulator [Sneathiella chinensis]GLQ05924.1 MarR family transcriptional regulator [Sneathiella chinensis]
MDQLNDALVSLRQIMRAADLNARKLAKETGLSISQLLVLQAIEQSTDLTAGEIAKEVNLTQATISSLLDRLEQRELVHRVRGAADRRKVYVALTETGRALLSSAPEALHDRFSDRFLKLETWEQSMMVAVLQRVTGMMEASDIDAAPVLDAGKIDRTPLS